MDTQKRLRERGGGGCAPEPSFRTRVPFLLPVKPWGRSFFIPCTFRFFPFNLLFILVSSWVAVGPQICSTKMSSCLLLFTVTTCIPRPLLFTLVARSHRLGDVTCSILEFRYVHRILEVIVFPFRAVFPPPTIFLSLAPLEEVGPKE